MNGTMKQAMLFGVEDIRIVEQPIPDPGPGEVLVRNRISTTCGTDVKNFKRGYPLLKPPHPYGHEFSGVVAALSLQNSIPNDGLRLAIAMVVGAVLAGVAGVIVGVPVLRLRGDYLAIVTLAFGEIIRNIFNVLYVGVDENGLHFSLQNEMALNLAEGGKSILKGPMGFTTNVKLATFTAGFILVLITLTIALNLINSRSGRAIMALRDNRIAAESVGIGATKYKLMAFVTSAVLAGAAGVLYAMNYSSMAPKKFDFNTSILILVFVVLGGIGNIRGSIIAAAFLTYLPELLRNFNLDEYRMLVYAIVLILVMLVTNNPMLKSVFTFAGRKARKEEAQKGGAVQ